MTFSLLLRHCPSMPHVDVFAAATRAGGPQTQWDQEAAGCSALGVVDAKPCDGGDEVMHLPQRAR